MNLIQTHLSEYSDYEDRTLEGELLHQGQRRAQYLADLLILSGYRGHSNRYRMVIRIDRPDWLTHMAQKHSPWDPDGQGLHWAIGLGVQMAADHYRACHSPDKIHAIPDAVYRLVKRAPRPGLHGDCQLRSSQPGMVL